LYQPRTPNAMTAATRIVNVIPVCRLVIWRYAT
jgi:hypothetical protein